jgi:hypothetical protein
MNEFRLIMLSAMYENGGNTTHRMFDGHPQLFVYPFESQVGTGFANDQFTSLVPVRYRWPEFPSDVTAEQAYEMFWDEELKTLLRVPQRSKFRDCGLVMDEDDRRRKFAAVVASKPACRATYVEAYYRSAFEAWTNYDRTGQECAMVGYNPVQVLDTDKILRDFPLGHVVHVVRNPWAGFADTLRRPFPLSLERYAWLWSVCQLLALTYRGKYPDRFHLVRFEDLAASPADTMRKVLGEVGLPMSEHCLAPSFNRKCLEQVYPWGTIRTPTPEANVATASSLDRDQIERMRVESSVMISAMGYDEFYTRHLAR